MEGIKIVNVLEIAFDRITLVFFKSQFWVKYQQRAVRYLIYYCVAYGDIGMFRTDGVKLKQPRK